MCVLMILMWTVKSWCFYSNGNITLYQSFVLEESSSSPLVGSADPSTVPEFVSVVLSSEPEEPDRIFAATDPFVLSQSKCKAPARSTPSSSVNVEKVLVVQGQVQTMQQNVAEIITCLKRFEESVENYIQAIKDDLSEIKVQVRSLSKRLTLIETSLSKA